MTSAVIPAGRENPEVAERIKVEVVLSIGLASCDIRDTIEIEAPATDEEIDAEVREWALERAEWSWQVSGD